MIKREDCPHLTPCGICLKHDKKCVDFCEAQTKSTIEEESDELVFGDECEDCKIVFSADDTPKPDRRAMCRLYIFQNYFGIGTCIGPNGDRTVKVRCGGNKEKCSCDGYLPGDRCLYYYLDYDNRGRCAGTREQDLVRCNGNYTRCDND